jgi:hypothetical protein
MSCPNVSVIQSNECIGNSLAGINDNFASLSDGICDNVNRITDIESDITNLTTQLNALSSLVTPGAAKAWVVFDATKNTDDVVSNAGARKIINGYNVSNIQTGVAGQFTITFTNNLLNKNYGVIATCSEKTASSGNYVWAQPGPNAEKNESNLTIYTRSINSTDTANPEYVSVLIL